MEIIKETFINLGTGETYLHNRNNSFRTNSDSQSDKINSIFPYKRGTIGAALDFTVLKAINGKRVPVRLVDCYVTLTAQKGTQPPFLDSLPCLIGPNQQFAGAGAGEFVFDDASAQIPAGEYDLEVTVTWRGGNSLKFPNSVRMPYGKLLVR